MEPGRIPIICQGYCSLVPITFVNEDAVPTEIIGTTNDVAERQGWMSTNNKKFSHDGNIVWLCPDCAKRWQKERREAVEYLFREKTRLHTEYLHTSDDNRARIVDVLLEQTRHKLADYEPTNEEWGRWYGI